MNTSPKFQHDCQTCIYVGSATVNGRDIDFYVCHLLSGMIDRIHTSIIARFGSDGPDYTSSPPCCISPLSTELMLGFSLALRHLGAHAAGGNCFVQGWYVGKANNNLLFNSTARTHS